MKRFVSLFLSVISIITCCLIPVNAADEEIVLPRVESFSLVSPVVEDDFLADNSRATGLIVSYQLQLSKTGTTLNIYGETYCISEVVKCGFKNLVIQRKKSTSSIWSEYYDYGDLYLDAKTASLNTTLAVESGYQYRISCKHYAKKSLLVTQNISNTSNVVAV